MGKGGGGSSTTNTSNIPAYARPYVMNMLGAAQNELFNTSTDAKGNTVITGMKGYKPFSTNPQDYFAPMSQGQNQAYQEALGMQTPGQFADATGMAGQAGQGGFSTVNPAYRYGAMGAGYGQQGAGIGLGALGYGQGAANIGQMGVGAAQQGFGAGQQFAQQATDPRSVAAYMSPYMQNVVDMQKAAAVRDYQTGVLPALSAQAARANAFGSSRDAIMRSEAARNLTSQLQNIQAQGQQQAFQNAQAQQQFGANLGLQGLQAGLQGLQTGISGQQAGMQGIQGALAGTAQGMQGAQTGLQGVGAAQAGYGLANQAASNLANIGTAQQQADLARIGLQNQLGQQQQAYQQGIINQQIQDYATQQQYPLMQLSTMSNLLRGLPMQGMTTQSYQAQAPAAQQLAGLAGAYGAYKGAFKEGGSVGLGYKDRGVVDSMRDRIEEMFNTDPEEAAKYVTNSNSNEVKKIGRELGIAAGNTGKLGTNLAGGGIIAFDEGGDVPRFSGEDGSYVDPDNPYGYTGFGEVMPYDPRTAIGAQIAPFERIRNALYGFGFKTKHQLQEEVKDRAKKETEKQTEKEDKKSDGAPTAAAPAAAPASNVTGNPFVTPTSGSRMDELTARQSMLKSLGVDSGQLGERGKKLLSYYDEDMAKAAERYGEGSRMNKALAFLEAGQDPRGLLAGAITGGKSYLKSEAELKKLQRAEKEASLKVGADIEKGLRSELRGDVDAAEKAYQSAEDRRKAIEVANIGARATMGAANRPSERERLAKGLMEADPKLTYEQAISRATGLMTTSDEAKQADLVKAAYTKASESIAPGGANYKEYKKLLDKDPEKAKQFVIDLAARQYQGMQSALTSIAGGNTGGGKPSVTNW